MCLYQECLRKGFAYPQMLRRWIDLKAAFRVSFAVCTIIKMIVKLASLLQNNYGWTPKGLRGALEDVGLNIRGREHCGLDDAKNTAYLAYRMLCDGVALDRFSEM